MKWDRGTDKRDLDELGFLVVEEHGLERWALDRILREMGALRVSTTANATDAFELLKGAPKPFDIVLWELDSAATESGLSLRQILERPPAPSVIFLSALDPSAVASYEATQRALGVGVLGTLDRPVTAEKLAPLIELHLATAQPAAKEKGRTP